MNPDRDLFEQALQGEPPLAVNVIGIEHAGQLRLRRRRLLSMLAVAGTVATVVFAVTLVPRLQSVDAPAAAAASSGAPSAVGSAAPKSALDAPPADQLSFPGEYVGDAAASVGPDALMTGSASYALGTACGLVWPSPDGIGAVKTISVGSEPKPLVDAVAQSWPGAAGFPATAKLTPTVLLADTGQVAGSVLVENLRTAEGAGMVNVTVLSATVGADPAVACQQAGFTVTQQDDGTILATQDIAGIDPNVMNYRCVTAIRPDGTMVEVSVSGFAPGSQAAAAPLSRQEAVTLALSPQFDAALAELTVTLAGG